MKSYVPPGLVGDRPLVIVLHGCTQSAERYATAAGWVTLAERLQFALVAPEQSSANNPNRCFNWFLDQDITRDVGEAASIAAMVGCAVDAFGSDPRQVFITGLSAGGAMTAVMLVTYPELFAGGAVVAGLPYGVAHSVAEAIQAMHRAQARKTGELADLAHAAAPSGAILPPLTIWHGDADWTVNVSNGEALARQWTGVNGCEGRPEELTEFPTHRQSAWSAPGSDVAAVELNVVFGMGHGTPIATGQPQSVGAVAPFVLEAGVSSTLEIARFWGLQAIEPVQHPNSSLPSLDPTYATVAASAEATRLGDRVMAAVSPHVSATVSDVITKALRAAGLM